MIQKSKVSHWFKDKASYKIISFISYEELKAYKYVLKNYLDEQYHSCCQAQVHGFGPRDHVIEEKN